MQELRKDVLTAQKVATGLVFRQMLGLADARRYLLEEQVPPTVIERVLTVGETRGNEVGASIGGRVPAQWHAGLAQAFYCNAGRRTDVVRAAIVEAALVVSEQLGTERAEALLQREKVAPDVIARVLAGDSSQRRARPEREDAKAPQAPAS
ncbi:hypothetical protein [Pseudoduganella chitinolytica]|uniref:Uncharacterized protein n=1 Tax=Pseudoduganella chitinolytica TaxID=34070 RepID=A0ABY8BMC6_9BURK|nr:hypothetical protein [Pseudoduganella chitinolytica]WEF35454.1 hypothetical protein PX653_12095 [Pseudoduganella chitinolytica]